MFASDVMLQSPFFYQKLHCNGWKSWSWGSKRSGVQRAHPAQPRKHFLWLVLVLSKKCFPLMWAFTSFSISKVALHWLQEEGSPLQQPCKRYLSAGRARQENRPPARKSSGKARKHGSKVQSGPMQESVSLPGKKLFKTGKKDNQEADRQATEQKTKCSWSSQVAKWLYHSDTMQLCQPNTDSCDLGIKS